MKRTAPLRRNHSGFAANSSTRFMKASFPTLDAVLSDSAGVDAATLDRLAADHLPTAPLLFHLVELAESEEPKIQVAVTGLLKRYQERGATFSDEVAARLLDLLPTVSRWEALLHILQMIAHLPIPANYSESLCDSARELLRHRNTFVRAWAYSALHHLAALYPAYRAEVWPLLEQAAQVEAASVRARLRQLPPLK